MNRKPKQSPEYVQCSTEAAIALGLKTGSLWRQATSHCLNLQLTYEEGCAAACAYCAMSRSRRPNGSGAHWPTHALREILAALAGGAPARRACLSMVMHPGALDDTVALAQAIRRESDLPISALVIPALVDAGALERLRDSGVDKMGIGFDAATPGLFERLRGRTGGGLHRWERCWECLEHGVEVFGHRHVGGHFVVGLGETELELIGALQTVHDLGGVNHLFSFCPQPGSLMENLPPPPLDKYRRMQIAAHLIDSGRATMDNFRFEFESGRVASFGLSEAELSALVEDGAAFMTRGCTGRDGRVACNRPFADSAPGPDLRNYPFPPEPEDVASIRRQLAGK